VLYKCYKTSFSFHGRSDEIEDVSYRQQRHVYAGKRKDRRFYLSNTVGNQIPTLILEFNEDNILRISKQSHNSFLSPFGLRISIQLSTAIKSIKTGLPSSLSQRPNDIVQVIVLHPVAVRQRLIQIIVTEFYKELSQSFDKLPYNLKISLWYYEFISPPR